MLLITWRGNDTRLYQRAESTVPTKERPRFVLVIFRSGQLPRAKTLARTRFKELRSNHPIAAV